MERIYKLNGAETPLDQILSYLEQELIYTGDTSKFEQLGIDFEDDWLDTDINTLKQVYKMRKGE